MVRREILRLGIFAKTVVSFCFRLLPSMKHTDSIIFFLDNAKKLIQNRPTPPPPPGGGGGGGGANSVPTVAQQPSCQPPGPGPNKKNKKIDLQCSMWNTSHDDK